MAIHSSIPAWKIPWTEEPSTVHGATESDMTEQLSTAHEYFRVQNIGSKLFLAGQCMCTQSCLTLCDPMECSLPRLLRPWDFPGKNTGVGYHFLLQEIFPTQGLNLGLPHYRQTLYRLSHQGSPGRVPNSPLVPGAKID